MPALRPALSRQPSARRGAVRRALSAVGAVSLVVVPSAAAIAADDAAAADPSPDATQPATPEVTLPAPEQVDQLDPTPSAPTAEAPVPAAEAPAPEPVAPDPTPTPSPGGFSAATPPPDAYFGTGKVNLTVVPDDGSTGQDLTTSFLVTNDDGETPPTQSTITTGADGQYDVPFGLYQEPGDELTITLTQAPEGYMIPTSATQVVPRCVVPSSTPAPPPPSASCTTNLAFDVVADYRTVAARTRTPGGAAVAGVTVELHSPDTSTPSPTPTPTESPTGGPTPPAEVAPIAGGDHLAAVDIPGRTLVATGVTDASGRVVFDTPVAPAAGYLLVPTSVPAGYVLPDPVSVDIPSVATVAEADLALDVPITVVPRAVTPSGPTAPVTPPRYAGPTLPDTGTDALALGGLAVLLVGAGVASVIGSRRSGARA